MKLTFYGGAQSVTGSNYLLEIKDPSKPSGVRKILIDCGLTQGCNFCEAHNWDDFGYNPKEIDEVFVTHAHIDHTGRLPKLIKDGFKGRVYSTPPTRDFAEQLLIDSQHILRQDAEHFKRPELYTIEHINELMNQWEGLRYHHELRLGGEGRPPVATVTLIDAGHILGSACVLIEAEGKKILFSGDLGNSPAPLIGMGDVIPPVDYCLIESTYGDRLHEDLSTRHQMLEDVIIESMKRGGVLMVPAFAMERTQILLLEMKEMLEKHEIPEVPIFLDSPLAIKLTAVYNRFPQYFKKDLLKKYGTLEEILLLPRLHMTMSTEDSKLINKVPSPKIIIAGAGMSTAGRILHHEKRYLSDKKSTLLIFGYQAKGSLGRLLLDGAKKVRILHEDVPVRAQIRAIGAYSAHADQEQLLRWIAPLKGHARKVFVVQGEETPSAVLAQKIHEQFGLSTEVPSPGQTVEL